MHPGGSTANKGAVSALLASNGAFPSGAGGRSRAGGRMEQGAGPLRENGPIKVPSSVTPQAIYFPQAVFKAELWESFQSKEFELETPIRFLGIPE